MTAPKSLLSLALEAVELGKMTPGPISNRQFCEHAGTHYAEIAAAYARTVESPTEEQIDRAGERAWRQYWQADIRGEWSDIEEGARQKWRSVARAALTKENPDG